MCMLGGKTRAGSPLASGEELGLVIDFGLNPGSAISELGLVPHW